MCGLFGHTLTGGDDLVLSDAALETLAHRGPDLRSRWTDERVYMGHARLSILDLSNRGRQPMLDQENTCAIAVNGEIYNYRELRADLSRKHRFASDSDSEVVLHGYKEWGISGMLHRLEGMYAFCIYDRLNRNVHLVRDRAGIKPLYYAVIGTQLIWASELKAIEAFVGRAALQTDNTALYDFLTYRYVPAPKTLYTSVQKLEPANVLSFELDTGRATTRRYWTLDPTPRQIGLPEAIEGLQSLLRRSVADQMVADVPVGFFLSGGIDSSTVVANAVAENAAKILTFSVDFAGEREGETAYAKLVAERLGARHRASTLTPALAGDFTNLLRNHFDEPFGDDSALPTFLVCQVARQDVTVALTGDGGDEVFGGYAWYDQIPRREIRGIVTPEFLRALVARAKVGFRHGFLGKMAEEFERRYLLSGRPLHLKSTGGMLPDETLPYRKLWGIPDDYDDYWYFRKFDRPDLPLRTRLQYLDFHTFLPDDILTKLDRTSMAVSLETRVPLLATDVVEFAFSLPEEVRYHGNRLKGLLKVAMAGTLPPEVIERPKRGFGMPKRGLDGAFRHGCRSRQEVLLSEAFADRLPAGLS